MTTEPHIAPDAPAPVDWTWARVEIFGHTRHYGRTREEERFGSKMLRIDVPTGGDPDNPNWQSVYYGGNAIFSFVPCTEEQVYAANKPRTPFYIRRIEPDPVSDDEEA